MENDFLRYINVETYHASQKKRKLPKKTKEGVFFGAFAVVLKLAQNSKEKDTLYQKVFTCDSLFYSTYQLMKFR
jgi:hypothetical protein